MDGSSEALRAAQTALCFDSKDILKRETEHNQLKEIPMSHFIIRAVLDPIMWSLLYWREYTGDKQFNRLVQHYYWFIIISCCFNVCLPLKKQNWCYPWRFMSCIQIIHLNVALRSINLGDGSIWQEFGRCTFVVLRMLDAA